MVDPWMMHSNYDDNACYRCEAGCGEHSCWRQGFSGRAAEPPKAVTPQPKFSFGNHTPPPRFGGGYSRIISNRKITD